MIITIKNKKFNVVKYSSKNKEVLCTCGSQCLVDGEAVYRIPIGLGFHSDGKFYSDYIQYTGYIGQCLVCGKNIFAYREKKQVSQRINIKGK